jgi:hypothetical protein
MSGGLLATAMRAGAVGAVTLLGCAALESRAQGTLDALADRFTFVSADGGRWARISAMSDLSLYAAEEPPPGLLFSDDTVFVAPRLSVTADAGVGERALLHVRLRADRGFDPGADDGGDVRVDEYFLQADLLASARGRLRLGKFATAFGGWVNRHLSWDNPLITAPAIYEDMVTITAPAAPADLPAFAARRDSAENKAAWVPVVWGPSYATGASIAAGFGSLNAALEVKSAALSAHPDVWDEGFDTDPTFTGRIGWHPRPEWTVGASFSHGPYLREDAEPTLPADADVDDFDQTTAGLDLSYERRRLQIWAELVQSRFEVPRVGEVETLGGFIEIRYKPAPRWWIAGRGNLAWFDDIPTLDTSWDRDLRRADLALGYRHSAHVQAKLEYSVGDQAGGNTNGNHLVAAQLVVWF